MWCQSEANTMPSKWYLKTTLKNDNPKHPCNLHRSQAILWSVNKLKKEDFVILDTETTGIGKSDQIVQIGIIDAQGSALLSCLVKPIGKRKFHEEAIDTHGITFEKVKTAETIDELLPKIISAVNGRTILAYNADFDKRLLDQSCAKANIPTPPFRWECVMLNYSQFCGEPSRTPGEYRPQKLPRKNKLDHHDATGDCHLTLELLIQMAETEARIGWFTWLLGKMLNPVLEKIWPD